MSVTDPLLKQLKNCTLQLVQSSSSLEVSDKNEHLEEFCKYVEKIFQKGLLFHSFSLGFLKIPESWYWLEEVATMEHGANYNYISSVNVVKNSPKVTTPLGKLRYLIRVCLAKRCLHVPVEILIRQKAIGQVYEKTCVMGDDILGEIFLSVLLQCSKITFKLDLKNCTFLDETWQLPQSDLLEFVPCKSLGISVKFSRGKAVVIAVRSNSLAAEDEKIKVGDILDELNGMYVNLNSRHKLSKVMKKGANQPVAVNIIRAWCCVTNDIFPPIECILRHSHIDPDEIRALYKPELAAQLLPKKVPSNESAGYPVRYVGSVCTGREGDVRQIERALLSMFDHPQQLRQSALFEIQEIGVRVVDQDTGEVVLKHSFMEISSCGRTLKFPHHFAYIAGNENCSTAKLFTCYAFFSTNEEHAQTILRSIGQGFQRTHFAV